jgi:hypothetical protein
MKEDLQICSSRSFESLAMGKYDLIKHLQVVQENCTREAACEKMFSTLRMSLSGPDLRDGLKRREPYDDARKYSPNRIHWDAEGYKKVAGSRGLESPGTGWNAERLDSSAEWA